MFKSDKFFVNQELMRIQYKSVLSEHNIANLSGFKIWRILKNESQNDRDAFMHFIISRWIDLQPIKDVNFLKSLKQIIRRSRIKMTDVDKYELTLLEERSFSEYRHIKVLEVSTELMPREYVGVKYVNAQLYKKTQRLALLTEADLLVSNKRIILVEDEILLHSFHWDQILTYTYTSYGFEFTYGKEKFIIRIHDQETLNNTIKNMISKKVKSAIKKEL